MLYFALSGLIGALFAIPLVAPLSIYQDPNPIGYVLILISFPIGGMVYRIRSRKWPLDRSVRKRQLLACLATLLLPLSIAVAAGMRAQGLHMTIVGGIVAGILMFAILVSGQRRHRNVA